MKPIDGKALAQQVAATEGRLVVAEDHWAEGGLGEAVLSALAEADTAPSTWRHLAVRRIPHSGKPAELLDAFGISARSIMQAIADVTGHVPGDQPCTR